MRQIFTDTRWANDHRLFARVRVFEKESNKDAQYVPGSVIARTIGDSAADGESETVYAVAEYRSEPLAIREAIKWLDAVDFESSGVLARFPDAVKP